MKTIEFKSLTIGVLGTALIFSVLGYSMQDKNMGNIVANSLTIISEGTEESGFILIKTSDGKKIAKLGIEKLLLKDFWTGRLDLYDEQDIRLAIFDTETLQISYDDKDAVINVDEMAADFSLRDGKAAVNLGASMVTGSHMSLRNTSGEYVWKELSGR